MSKFIKLTEYFGQSKSTIFVDYTKITTITPMGDMTAIALSGSSGTTVKESAEEILRLIFDEEGEG